MKYLAKKSGRVNFLTNLISASVWTYLFHCVRGGFSFFDERDFNFARVSGRNSDRDVFFLSSERMHFGRQNKMNEKKMQLET